MKEIRTFGNRTELWSNFLNAFVVEAIWSTSLTDQQAALLREGVSPTLIEPESLEYFGNLYRGDLKSN